MNNVGALPTFGQVGVQSAGRAQEIGISLSVRAFTLLTRWSVEGEGR